MINHEINAYPLRFIFSGYTVIGLTLFIISSSVAVYLLFLKKKSNQTKALIVFYVFVALSGIATVLSNAIVHWQRMFLPWQDFWIISGGVALVVFTYLYAERKQTNEAKVMIIIISSLAVSALIYCLIFSFNYLFYWNQNLIVSDSYYLILPISILIVIFSFLRNSMLILRKICPDVEELSINERWKNYILTKNKDVITLRNFGLAIILSFLPGLQTLIKLPDPTGFILSNIGSILAIIAISLVYFNYAPDINSFLIKLVGITLATVLLILSIFGTIDIYFESRQVFVDRLDLTFALSEVLMSNEGELPVDLPAVAYIVSWDASSPRDASTYELIFDSGNTEFSLERLIEQNQEGQLELTTNFINNDRPQSNNVKWRSLQRFWNYPQGSTHEDYLGYLFTTSGREYEIGYASFSAYNAVSRVVSNWLILILSSSGFILLVFPKFFQNVLVKPIDSLLNGISRVNQGDLDTEIKPYFNDEIGSLTLSFNKMVESLRDLTNKLKDEATHLESLVEQRNQELAQANKDLKAENVERIQTETILNQQLNYQRALSLCSQALLKIRKSNESHKDILNYALETLRFGANASRAYIFKIIIDEEMALFARMLAEVCAPGIPPHINNPANQKFPVSALPNEFVQHLSNQENFGGKVVELFIETENIKNSFLNQTPPLLSIQIFPIFIEQKWWGFVGFDECNFERMWTHWENTMLQTAAQMIGNTIHRWRIQDHLNETLDQLEHRVEERTIELRQANQNLQLEIKQRQIAQEDVERRLFIEEKLSIISEKLLRTEHIKENISSSLKDLAQILHAGRIVVVEFDINNFAQIEDYIEFHKTSLQPLTKEMIEDYIRSLTSLREQLHQNHSIVIPDIMDITQANEIKILSLEGFTPQSLVLSPLIINERIHGVLGCGIFETNPEQFQMNLQILDLVASMLTSLFQRQHLIEDLELQVGERTQQLTTFLDIAILGENAQDLNDILQPVLYSISQLMASDAVCIHIVDETKAELILIAQYGIPLIDVSRLQVINVHPEITRWMEKKVSYEKSERSEKNPALMDVLSVDSYKTFLANPIGKRFKVLGILSCYRIDDQNFSSFERMFINSLGELIGIIIENHRLRLEAKELATVDERQRLAREIHDAISQSVYSLSLFARSASDALSENNQTKLKENLKDIEKIALQAMREMRLLIYQLREELGDEDFAYALDIRYQQVENRLGIEASHNIDKNIILPENIHHHLWRIIVEALNNSVKYAEAKHVNVKLSQTSSNMLLEIEDDGVGFDVNQYSPGMGLKNIRTRTQKMNGECEIISRSGYGTLIRIKIPIDKIS